MSIVNISDIISDIPNLFASHVFLDGGQYANTLITKRSLTLYIKRLAYVGLMTINVGRICITIAQRTDTKTRTSRPLRTLLIYSQINIPE